MRARAWLGLGAVAGVVLGSPQVGANPAAAEALFREGRKLMEAGQLDQACPKLAESFRLDPSPGALGNLALCHEKQGKTATAWAEYLSTARLGAAQGKQSVAAAAKERAAALEGKLIYLTIKVQSPVAGQVVKRDGQVVDASSFDTRLPVDPGRSTLQAEAPGHEPYSEQLSLVEGKTDTTATVPPLKKSAAAPTASATAAPTGTATAPPSSAQASATAAPTAPGTAPAAGRGRPVSGYVVGGAGFAALGVGAFLGLSSLSDYRTAERACQSHTNCSKNALDSRDKAQSKAWGANIGVGLGVVGVALGTYLLFFSKEEASASTVRVGGNVARDGAALEIAGGF